MEALVNTKTVGYMGNKSIRRTLNYNSSAINHSLRFLTKTEKEKPLFLSRVTREQTNKERVEDIN